uniref:Uncharacterized protein n=1 Tax=Anguilla anguilla TaxID=7936 RepID=A0A0E9SK88_ANGAN
MKKSGSANIYTRLEIDCPSDNGVSYRRLNVYSTGFLCKCFI